MPRKTTVGALIVLMTASLTAQSGHLGTVHFPTSGSAEAQHHFVEGVLYLHSFEFEDAAEEFVKAQQLDPDFAMAYWGESMTHNHPLWRQVDVEAGRAVLARLGATPQQRLAKAPTAREKDFLRALDALYGEGDKAARDRAYHDVMEKMYERYPDDQEVAAFYALSILGLTNGTRDFRNYMKAASIVEEVFAANPKHPGAAHYLIHSYDDPIHAPLGLRAARVYNTIAPSASHAQHMISHIYVALGRWEESVRANETAWEVSMQRVRRKNRDISEADFHSFGWLHYAYLQQGRYREAHKMIDTVVDARRHTASPRLSYSRMRAGQVVEGRDPNVSLPPSTGNFTDRFADAWIAIEKGDLDAAREAIAGMEARRDTDRAVRKQVEGLVLLEEKRPAEALAALKESTALEDASPLSFGPPYPIKPTHELLGEVLLQLDRPAEARSEFEKALERAPRRALSLLGLARSAARSGDAETATEAYTELASVWEKADSDVEELKEVREALRAAAPSGGR